MTKPPEDQCEQLGELLSAYFDQQLAPDQMQQVEAHLAECRLCRGKLAAYTQIRNAIVSKTAHPPIDLARAIIEKLERDQLLAGFETLATPAAPKATRFLKAFAAAAMILLIASISILLLVPEDWSFLPRPEPKATREKLPPAPHAPRGGAEQLVTRPEPKEIGPLSAGAYAEAKEEASPTKLARVPVQPVVTKGEEADAEARSLDTTTVVRPSKPREEGVIALGMRSEAPSAEQDSYRAAGFGLGGGAALKTFIIYTNDPPAWMYARDRLVATLRELSLQEVGAADVTPLPGGQKEAFAKLPPTPGTPDNRYHARVLVNVRSDKVEELRRAVDHLQVDLADVSTRGVSVGSFFLREDRALAPTRPSPLYEGQRAEEPATPDEEGRRRLAKALPQTSTQPARTTAVIVEVMMRPPPASTEPASRLAAPSGTQPAAMDAAGRAR